MSKFRSSVASALSFAHLAGLGFRSAKAESDPDEKDDKKDSKADGDNPKDDDKKEGRRAQRADESDDEYAEYNDGEDEKDDKKDKESAKSAKADDEDAEDDDKKDDDEDEMRGKSAAASARRRERSRCAAIMGSKMAARNVVLAANLAFNTTMTRQQAIAVLRDTPAASVPDNGRSARNPSLGAGGESGMNSRAAVASSWDIAMQRARPSRK